MSTAPTAAAWEKPESPRSREVVPPNPLPRDFAPSPVPPLFLSLFLPSQRRAAVQPKGAQLLPVARVVTSPRRKRRKRAARKAESGGVGGALYWAAEEGRAEV